MKPDYDDYDDYENPGSRWVSVLVLLLAVAGFMALAWYAYQTGADQAQTVEEEVVVIEAADTPVKEKPEDAGGMEFPHQEKTIYDAISKSADGGDEPHVSVLKDEVDESAPVMAEDTPLAKPAKERADEKVARLLREGMKGEDEKADADAEPEQKPEAKKIAEKQTKEPEAKEEAPVLKQPDPFEAVEKPAAPTHEQETPKQEAVQVSEPAAPSDTEVKAAPVKAEEPKPAASLLRSSSAMIQLGAYGSQAEADANWRKISAAHADVLARFTPQVVRADLGAKGVFYRLRVHGFASATVAKATCASLSARGQGCFLVQ